MDEAGEKLKRAFTGAFALLFAVIALFLLLALWAGIAYGRGKHHDKEEK